MKLGEALNRRADLRARLQQLPSRVAGSVVAQEGDAPPEDPEALLVELDGLADELGTLIAAINLTNARTTMGDGRTVTEAIAERDVLATRQSVLRSIVDAADKGMARYSRSELRMVRHVDVGRLRRTIDELARRRRELDTAIQEHNWTTDLIEQ